MPAGVSSFVPTLCRISTLLTLDPIIAHAGLSAAGTALAIMGGRSVLMGGASGSGTAGAAAAGDMPPQLQPQQQMPAQNGAGLFSDQLQHQQHQHAPVLLQQPQHHHHDRRSTAAPMPTDITIGLLEEDNQTEVWRQPFNTLNQGAGALTAGTL